MTRASDTETFARRADAPTRRVFLGGLAAVWAWPAGASDRPARVVIAGGALTEIAFALGAGDRIAGVDVTSNYPEAAAEKAQIGYFRSLAPEGLLALAPDLILAEPEAGPASALERVEAAGVPVLRGPDGEGPAATVDKIAFVGEALGLEAEAERAIARYRAQLAEVQAKVARLPGRPKALFVMSFAAGAPVVGGAGTSADAILAEAGAVNVAASVEGWKPMSREAILAAAPDAVVMMTQGVERLGGEAEILGRPDLSQTPAGRDGRLIALEGMLLLGFGPRTPQAIAELARALHPQDAAAAGL
ncbi:MAG: ABC transporter substrate-binding protein [Pseudomonadota bacterium]